MGPGTTLTWSLQHKRPSSSPYCVSNLDNEYDKSESSGPDADPIPFRCAIGCGATAFSSCLHGQRLFDRGTERRVGQRWKTPSMAAAEQHWIFLLGIFSFAVDHRMGPIQSRPAALLLLLFRF